MIISKAAIITAIQTVADASPSLRIQAAFGSPGNEVLLDGETRDTGEAYIVPGSIDTLIDGIAQAIIALEVDLAKGPRISGLVSSELSTVLRGEALKADGDATFTRYVQGDPDAFIGIADVSIGPSTAGDVRPSGRFDAVLLVGGLIAVSGGDLLYPSVTPGYLTTVDPGGGAPIVGVVLDGAAYAGSSTVDALIR